MLFQNEEIIASGKIMKEKFKQAYMKTAKIFADLSYAQRLHVGAIVVKDDRIISIGYNGMPAGWNNECENLDFVPDGLDIDYSSMIDQGYVFGADKDTAGYIKRVTKPEVLHAESNAIAKLARSNESGLGADIFITHSPCIECAKLIYQSGIKRVCFGTFYRDDAGINFLKKSGIVVEQLEV